MSINLFNADFREVDFWGAGKVDAIITDLPYGTTAQAWDEVIPPADLWSFVDMVLKPGGAFITTANFIFGAQLAVSNLDFFKYDIVWDKGRGSNPLTANIMPQISHELVLIFGDGAVTFNPQFTPGSPYKGAGGVRGEGKSSEIFGPGGAGHSDFKQEDNDGYRYPKSVLFYSIHTGSKLHPNEKPLGLYEWLIRSYTNPGELVLDICMGSGTTGEASVTTGRSFIGIEKEERYYKIAKKKIDNATPCLPGMGS